MTGEWPRETWRRRTVLVLNDGDVDFLRYEGGGNVLLDDEVHIIEFPLDAANEGVSMLGSRLRRGDVLVQSPYDEERYEPLQDSIRAFAKEKCRYVSRVCQMLGAREVKFQETTEHVEESRKTDSVKGSATVKGGPLGGSGSAGYYSEFEGGLLEELRLQLKEVFAGGDPDVAGAETLLRESNLTNDVDLRNLIEMRKHARNPLKSMSIRLVFVEAASYMKRTLASLDVEAMYGIASGSLGVRGEHEERWRQLMRHKLNLRVEF